MHCDDVKIYLDDNITAGGFELPPEFAGHIASCAECRAYFQEAKSFIESLAPINNLEMTAAETVAMERQILATIEAEKADLIVVPRERRVVSILRYALAAAAVLAIMLISSGKQSTGYFDVDIALDEMALNRINTDDVLAVFYSDETDYLPQIVDSSEAAYITERLSNTQAADYLEDASTEEIEWLMANYTFEI